MRNGIILLALTVAAAATAGERSRTLSYDRPADGITSVRIEAGVGEVEVLTTNDPAIKVCVEITADGSSWGSRRSLRDFEEIELQAEERADVLTLRLRPERRSKNWGEEWSVYLPAAIARDIELGVGDVRVLDAAADVSVEVGVGEVEIEGVHAAFRTVSAECGVGDVSLRTPEGREDGSGFISHELHATGPGSAAIQVEVGVGDVVIRLR